MRVLVTRAEPAASLTAEKFKSAGFNPIVMPLFEVADTGNEMPERHYDGVVFTSSNAASVLAARGWRADADTKVAYCVGPKTANAVRKLGFSEIVTTDGGGEALAEKIISQKGDVPGNLLYPAPVERAFDMASALKGDSIHVDVVEIYDHRKRTPDAGELESLRTVLGDCVVTAYSDKTAAYAAEILFATSKGNPEFSPTLVAISKNTAESVLKYPWHGVYVADRPDEAAIIEKIKEITLSNVAAGRIL